MRTLFPILLVLLCGRFLPAQELGIQGPEPAQVAPGGVAQLTLAWDLEHGAQPRLIPPEVSGLKIQAGGPGYFESHGRGRSVRQVQWQVLVQPEKVGTFEIPPFRVRVGRQLYRSKATSLRVVEDPRAKDVLRLELAPIRESYRLGETLELSLDVLVEESILPKLALGEVRRRQLGVLLDIPWLEASQAGSRQEVVAKPEDFQIPIQRTWQPCRVLGSVEKEGRLYRSFRVFRRFVLERPGRYGAQEGAARVQWVTQHRRDVFGDPVPTEKANSLVKVTLPAFEVRDLPEEGRPEGFVNAVGRFRLEGSVDRARLALGESLQLTLNILGEGNLSFLEVPELEDLPGFHRYERKVERQEGRIVAVYELAPTEARVRALPELRFPFFDPATNRYEVATLAPIPLTIDRPADAPEIERLPTEDEGLVAGVDDIHDRMPIAELPAPGFRPGLALVIGTGALPPLLVLCWWFGIERRRQRLREDPRARRRQGAEARFATRLQGEGALRAFSLFLAERFGWDDGAAVDQGLAARLEVQGVASALALDCEALSQELQASRYGGSSDEAGQAARAAELVSRLGRELR